MIYASAVLALFLLSPAASFTPSLPVTRRKSGGATRIRAATADERNGLITVRFINPVGGKDVVTTAEPGANLLLVGDAAGVKLPRACRTGLCGSCTCDLQDPLAIKTATNARDGFATIRACSVKCFLPEGMDEMVVDVYRMGVGKGRKPVVPSSATSTKEEEQDDDSSSSSYTDPMARFSGNWEKEFRPNWELQQNDFSGPQVGGASNPNAGSRPCLKCAGLKRLQCYNCAGSGKVMMGSVAGEASGVAGRSVQCSICVGSRSVACAYCRGTGQKLISKTMR